MDKKPSGKDVLDKRIAMALATPISEALTDDEYIQVLQDAGVKTVGDYVKAVDGKPCETMFGLGDIDMGEIEEELERNLGVSVWCDQDSSPEVMRVRYEKDLLPKLVDDA